VSLSLIAFLCLAYLLFLCLPVRLKLLLSLIVMSNGFDLLPPVMAGWLTWDFGAWGLLLAAGQVLLRKAPPGPGRVRPLFVYALGLFWLWMLVPLIWSLFIYDYPAYGTLKYARHMLVGYLSFFVFLRFFETSPAQFERLLKELYWLSLALMSVCIVQFALQKRILFGLYQDYATVMRFLPIALPVCLLFAWRIFRRAMRAVTVKWHEIFYAAVALSVLITTFTRGLYLACLTAVIMGILLLGTRRQLQAKGFIVTCLVLFVGLGTAGVLGGLDLALSRFKSGAELLTNIQLETSANDVDTFTGRLMLARERFAMVLDRNPIVGYGFLNEDDVWPKLRSSLKYGSIVYSPEMVEAYRYGHPYVLAFHSADISWGDLVLNTGLVGTGLFLFAMLALGLSYLPSEAGLDPQLADWRFAFLLQTLVMLMLTFNGNPIIVNVQLFSFMLAGLAYTSTRYAVNRPRIYNALLQETAPKGVLQ
jgi:hypothetical protein